MLRIRNFLPVLLWAGFCLIYLPPQLSAQATNRAALVVRLADGNVHTQCVDFPEPQINGYELLLRSGLNVAAEVQGAGALVCSIDNVGCGADDCLCQCQGGGDCIYWSYWYRQGGGWQYSQAGASQYPVGAGAVQGWSWGPGAANVAIPPPDLSFADICQPEATVTPTATAVPPTDTPLPTHTPAPTRSPEVDFSVDADAISAGACTTLRWRVAHITAVFLNDIGVVGEDAQQVCPAQTETFTLRITHPAGEEARALTVTVLEATASQPPPTSAPVAQVAVVAATPIPPTATRLAIDTATPVMAASATNPPTALPQPDTPSPTIIWVTVPPLATETPMAAAVIADLPATPTVKPVTAPATAPTVTAAAGVDWLPYVAFVAIITGLALLLFRAARQPAAS